MKDLKNPTVIWIKGGLFLLLGSMAFGLIVFKTRDALIAALLALCVWAFCRAYYFAFYVIEHYVDPSYRFRGLGAFLGYMLGKPADRMAATDQRAADASDVP